MNIEEFARKEELYLQRIRNKLHEYPELGWEETKSISILKNLISEINVCAGRKLVVHNHYKGGLIIDLIIHEDPSSLFRLFRSDLDALPIVEDENNEPKSKVDGKMHACGHDIHAAVLITSMKLLSEEEMLQPKHNLRFVFQRAEEVSNSKSGGFVLVCEENILENVKDVFGFHIYALNKAGAFFSRGGAFLGNCAKIEMFVESTGGHVMEAHRGGNALRVILELCRILEDTANQNKDPFSTLLITPVICQSGNADNVMPSTARMTFSFRNLMKEEEVDRIFDLIKSALESRAKLLRSKVSLVFNKGSPTLFNTPKYFEYTKQILTSFGKLETHEAPPCLAGEDFSFYLQKKPGIMWAMGGSNSTPQENEEKEGEEEDNKKHKIINQGPAHSPTFNPSKRVFWKGVVYWLTLALN